MPEWPRECVCIFVRRFLRPRATARHFAPRPGLNADRHLSDAGDNCQLRHRTNRHRRRCPAHAHALPFGDPRVMTMPCRAARFQAILFGRFRNRDRVFLVHMSPITCPPMRPVSEFAVEIRQRQFGR